MNLCSGPGHSECEVSDPGKHVSNDLPWLYHFGDPRFFFSVALREHDLLNVQTIDDP